jgi:hypothetical protein
MHVVAGIRGGGHDPLVYAGIIVAIVIIAAASAFRMIRRR